jgi:hypothetical protein
VQHCSPSCSTNSTAATAKEADEGGEDDEAGSSSSFLEGAPQSLPLVQQQQQAASPSNNEEEEEDPPAETTAAENNEEENKEKYLLFPPPNTQNTPLPLPPSPPLSPPLATAEEEPHQDRVRGEVTSRRLTMSVGGVVSLYEGTSVRVKCPVGKGEDRQQIEWFKDSGGGGSKIVNGGWSSFFC